jgi:hypothetical protein
MGNPSPSTPPVFVAMAVSPRRSIPYPRCTEPVEFGEHFPRIGAMTTSTRSAMSNIFIDQASAERRFATSLMIRLSIGQSVDWMTEPDHHFPGLNTASTDIERHRLCEIGPVAYAPCTELPRTTHRLAGRP